MPELSAVPQEKHRSLLPILLLGIFCIFLTCQFKEIGFILSTILSGVFAFLYFAKPNQKEIASLRFSIDLSLDDIQQTIDQYTIFSSDNSPEALADRTYYRPALLDKDSADPDIQAFYYLLPSSVRFIERVEERLEGKLSVAQLEAILTITDKRAAELQQAWTNARQAAKRNAGHL